MRKVALETWIWRHESVLKRYFNVIRTQTYSWGSATPKPPYFILLSLPLSGDTALQMASLEGHGAVVTIRDYGPLYCICTWWIIQCHTYVSVHSVMFSYQIIFTICIWRFDRVTPLMIAVIGADFPTVRLLVLWSVPPPTPPSRTDPQQRQARTPISRRLHINY